MNLYDKCLNAKAQLSLWTWLTRGPFCDSEALQGHRDRVFQELQALAQEFEALGEEATTDEAQNRCFKTAHAIKDLIHNRNP